MDPGGAVQNRGRGKSAMEIFDNGIPVFGEHDDRCVYPASCADKIVAPHDINIIQPWRSLASNNDPGSRLVPLSSSPIGGKDARTAFR